MHFLFVIIIALNVFEYTCAHKLRDSTPFEDDSDYKSALFKNANTRKNVKTMRLAVKLIKYPEYPHARGRTELTNKRSLRSPAQLARIFQRVYNNPDLRLTGEILYVAKRAFHADFRLGRRIFRNKDILKAELHVYKKALTRKNIKNKNNLHAIVGIHQVLGDAKTIGSRKLIDFRIIHVDSSGWIKFDVTSTVREWQRCRRCNNGLDLWVESIKPGSRAAKIARRFKFVKVNSKDSDHTPAITLFFTEKTDQIIKTDVMHL